MFIYVVVDKEVETFDDVQKLTEKYEQIGVIEESWMKDELQGQPILKGLVSCMYDGMRDGKHVIRYETPEAYDMVSKDLY